MKCEICGEERSMILKKEFTASNVFAHVGRKHGITRKEYYDKYLKKATDGFCKFCGEETCFKDGLKRYSNFCNASHQTLWVMQNNTAYKENFVNAAKKYWATDEGKIKRTEVSSLSRKNFWSDPERKQKAVAKMTKSIQEKWDNDPVYKAKCVAASIKTWQDEAYRTKICEAQSIGAARRIARVGNGHSDKNYKTGSYFSAKGNKSLYYASSYERTAYEKLENDENVSSYDRAKVAIKYIRPDDHRFHRYVPDILVEMKDGNKMLIEIKPTSMLEDEIIKAKIEAGNLYCLKKGWQFAVWSEKDLNNGT